MEIQGTQDDYKVKVINQAMEAMFYNDYYITRLKGDNTKAINLNEPFPREWTAKIAKKRNESYFFVVFKIPAFIPRSA